MSSPRRFLLDEQVSFGIKVAVEQYVSGAQCVHVGQLGKGMSDRNVYNAAQRGKQIIVTGDRDFTQKKNFPATYPGRGIIYVENNRVYSQQTDVVDALLTLSKKRISYSGSLVVIRRDGYADVIGPKGKVRVKLMRHKKKCYIPSSSKAIKPFRRVRGSDPRTLAGASR